MLHSETHFKYINKLIKSKRLKNVYDITSRLLTAPNISVPISKLHNSLNKD
jgi:hypothetical protein